MTIRRFRENGRRFLMVAFCSGALCALPAISQDTAPTGPPPGQMGGGPRGGGARQLEMLTKRLDLTADQQTKVKAIDEDTGKQMMTLRNDTSLSQDDRRSKMMDIRKSSQDKIRAILTDDQKTKYDALLAEMRDRMRQGPPPPQ